MDETLMMKINKASKMWKEKTKFICLELNIPESYRPVLFYVSKNPGCTQKDVCLNSRFKASTISTTIKEMINNDMVIKKMDENDSRAFNLYLTEKGEDAISKIRKRLREIEKNSISNKLIDEENSIKVIDEVLNLLEGDIDA